MLFIFNCLFLYSDSSLEEQPLSPKSPRETSKVSDGEKTPTQEESQAPGEYLSIVKEELSAHKQQKKETTPSARTEDNEVIILSSLDWAVLCKEIS